MKKKELFGRHLLCNARIFSNTDGTYSIMLTGDYNKLQTLAQSLVGPFLEVWIIDSCNGITQIHTLWSCPTTKEAA